MSEPDPAVLVAMSSPVNAGHNHLTRDIKDRGICPACDRYWERADERDDD